MYTQKPLRVSQLVSIEFFLLREVCRTRICISAACLVYGNVHLYPNSPLNYIGCPVCCQQNCLFLWDSRKNVLCLKSLWRTFLFSRAWNALSDCVLCECRTDREVCVCVCGVALLIEFSMFWCCNRPSWDPGPEGTVGGVGLEVGWGEVRWRWVNWRFVMLRNGW